MRKTFSLDYCTSTFCLKQQCKRVNKLFAPSIDKLEQKGMFDGNKQSNAAM